jgi:Flp pilus assembly protein TadG
MAVEMVIAVPSFLLLLLLIAGGANWVSASGQVGGAARDAARAASVARTWPAAVTAADAAAQYDLGTLCSGGSPVVNVIFTGGTSFATATAISVTVHCPVNLKVFRVVGLDNTNPFTEQSIAPLDPFVTRTS